MILLRFLIAALLLASPLDGQEEPRWTPLGPFGGTVRHLTADPSTRGVVYATAGDGGAFKSTDGGATWTSLITRPVLSAVAVDPSRLATLYLTARAAEGTLLKSTDAGASWTPSNRGLEREAGASAVAVDPVRPSRVYLGNGRGFFRSLNGGASWRESPGFPETAVHAIAVPPRPAGVVLAATNVGVLRSTDAGVTWKPGRGLPRIVGQTLPIAVAVVVAPSDPRTVYASFPRHGVCRSTDGGATWQRPGGPQSLASPGALAVSSRSPRTVFAVSGGAVHRSTDGGARWVRIGPTTTAVLALAADPFSARNLWAGLHAGFDPGLGGVFRSLDGGATWRRSNRGLAALPAWAGVPAADPGALWAGLGLEGIFRSADQGRRWTRVPMPPPQDGGSLRVFRVDAFSASAALVQATTSHEEGITYPTSFWKTEDAGGSWTLTAGLGTTPSVSQARLTAADPSHPPTLYVLETTPVDVQRLLRTTDAGDSWEVLSDNIPLGCAFGGLAVAPSDPSVLYAAGSGPEPAFACRPPWSARILRSADGGVTWTKVTGGPFLGEVVSAVAVDPLDEDLVYAGIGPGSVAGQGDGVWRSADGGATWERAGGELAGRPVTALLASAIPGRVYAVVDENRIYRTDDGGDTWEEWSERLTVVRISALHLDSADPDRIYASTTNGVWVLEED